MARFRIEVLAKSHDRSGFDCASEPLNHYLAKQVSQDVRRNVATCFLVIEAATETVAGYYTVSAGSIPIHDLPEKTVKKLPRYPAVPVLRIGRLAVDQRFQGERLGRALLFDALKRGIDSEIAMYAAVVDAKDDQAVAFYEHFGFQHLPSKPLTLFLPLSDAVKALGS